MTRPLLGLAISAEDAAGGAARPPGYDAAAVGAAAALVLVGGDRPPRPRLGLDPSIALPVLASLLPSTAFVVVDDPRRAHPYDIARRTASLHRLHGRRLGVALEESGRPEDGTVDAAGRAIRELWASWPESTLILDKETGVFATIDGIRRINATGRFEIEGPLTLPLDPDDSPLLVRLDPTGDRAGLIRPGEADLVIVRRPRGDEPAGDPVVDDPAVPRAIALDIPAIDDVGDDHDITERLRRELDRAEEHDAPALIVSAPAIASDPRSAAILRAVVTLVDEGAARRPASGTVRERLGLAACRVQTDPERSTGYPARRMEAP